MQVDAYNDYIGGEVLSSIRLAKEVAVHDRYIGPKKAIISGMKIF